ncbi:response regulator, partial [Escherichia coli]|uniref:response regulator n=1 Tax=Escherichia coli TaxID=562 RepID=UPI003F276BC0
KRVLYVDDDEALVMLTTRKLKRMGYVTTGESNPLTALKRLKDEPDAFDAVVTDLSMPHMTGFDLAREILALRPELPVLLTSG